MEEINKKSYLPYYLQIKDILKERIMNKVYLPNMLIPSENELCDEFHVTRATIRNALYELKKEGLIQTEKGKGSKVSPPKIEQSLLKFYSIGKELKNFGENAASYTLSKGRIKGTMDIANKLEIAEGTEVFEIVRIRFYDEEPLILETAYIPVSLTADLLEQDLEQAFIYDLLENKYGLKIIKAKETIEPKIANEYEAKHLRLGEYVPVFYTERITLTYAQKPIEFRNSVIRGDKFKFYTELY
ncbi:MAG: GntR family transcriptional regulator [Thermotaleaceae bacterium]